MKRALLLVTVGCSDEAALTPPWQLAHDRVVAVRVTPPHLLPGETARIEGLIARANEPVFTAEPTGASAPFAAAGLFVAVHYNLDHWEINGPDEPKLADARAELGLAADAPVPLVVTLQFPGPLYAEKTVWLGDSHANPVLPDVRIDGEPAGDSIALAVRAGAHVVIEARDGDRVRWLSSCGELAHADEPEAELVFERPCAGELAVVVRDTLGGIVWHVWPLLAR